MSGGFVLIASYPKSGNTWIRMALQKLRRGINQPVSINDLDVRYQDIFRRVAFDDWMPVNAADLSVEEIEGFLPDLYRRLAPEIRDFAPIKVHDNARRNVRGEWIYPPDCVRAVIYLVRHPFDVAVSLANHLNAGVERAVAMMADDGSAHRPPARLVKSLPQNFGTWSGNVASWLDNPFYPVTWARYEDLCEEPLEHIVRFAKAAGLPASRDDVEAAVRATDFQVLQREETESGFREKFKSSPQFFRSGRPGAWRGILDATLRERLVRDHGHVMERLGYGAEGEVNDLPASQ